MFCLLEWCFLTGIYYRHGLSAVTEEDIAPQIGLGRDSYLFRLWPPRVPGELGPTPMVME